MIYDDIHDEYHRGFEIRVAQGFAMMSALLTKS